METTDQNEEKHFSSGKDGFLCSYGDKVFIYSFFFFFFKNNAAVANWFGIFKIRSALNFARRCALNENAACCQRATQRFTLIDSLMSGESLL